MAEFITKCPHCNEELQAQDEWIGMEVECPNCKKVFTVKKYHENEPQQNFEIEKPTFLDRFVGGIIQLWRNINWEILDKNLRKVFISFGSIMFLGLGIAFCIGGFVIASKQERPMYIVIGVCIFLSCIFLAYLGEQIFKLGDNLIKRNSNIISSIRLLNCFFIFFFFIALGLLIGGIYLGYTTKSIQLFYSLFLGAFSLFITSVVALKPQLINLQINESSSSDEDWISIIQFFVKGNLFIIPYYWGLYLTVLCINLIVRLGAEEYVLVANFTATIPQMAIVGFSPLIAYLMFLGVSFTLNFAKAVLVIPQKLDIIVEKTGKAQQEK